MNRFNRIRTKVQEFLATETGQRLQTVVRWTFIIGILSYLGIQLFDLGWQRIWESLPRVALFYLIFVVMYMVLPLLETFIYRKAWNISYWKSIPVFQKKRVLNSDVVGYSGEVYLFMWARRKLSLGEGHILRIIKDNTIISSAGSTLIAIGLLSVFFLTGTLDLIPFEGQAMHVIGVILLVGLLIGLGVTFRKSIFTLSGKLLATIFGLHLFRMLLLHTLQILQWMVVLPDVSLGIWASFLAVKIVIQQLPFLPTKDLVFLGSSFEISQALGVPPAPIAAMLLVSVMLSKVSNAGSFLVISLFYSDPDIEKVKEAELQKS